MKVMVVMGTRPEVIKLAPVVTELRNRNVETIVCCSGQHREMLQQALSVFAIKPDIMLDVMAPNQTLNTLAAKLITRIDEVLQSVLPDWVLVQGDTTTAFCAAFSAFHLHINVGHIEAGLRTGNLNSPFPEEGNRSLLARIASQHFAPTLNASKSLEREFIAGEKILITGNTVVDSIEMMRSKIELHFNTIKKEILTQEQYRKPLILVTCHRRENFGGTLESICELLKRMANQYSEYHWVFPVHLNPNVQEPVQRILYGISNLTLLAPLDYLTTLAMISHSVLIVTDSGGIQEEAPSFGVPVVVMRTHTEREEGVQAGFASLAGQEPDKIEQAIKYWLNDTKQRQNLQLNSNPYGDGLASRRIVANLLGEELLPFNG